MAIATGADIGKAAGCQFPLLEKIFHHRPDQDGDVVGLTVGDALLQLRRKAINHRHLAATGAFEFCRKVVQCRFQGD
jgi:hypothetical protein